MNQVNPITVLASAADTIVKKDPLLTLHPTDPLPYETATAVKMEQPAATETTQPTVIVVPKDPTATNPQLKSDTYFPIYIYPGSGSTDTAASSSASSPLTDEQKRQRAIIIASVVLVLLILLILFLSYRKRA